MLHEYSRSSAKCCVQDDDPPPTWSMGTPVPIGAALVALVGLVIAAMWVDTVASELVRLCSLTRLLLLHGRLLCTNAWTAEGCACPALR